MNFELELSASTPGQILAPRVCTLVLFILKDFLLVQLSMDYQQDSVVGENPPSELRGQFPTGSGTDRVRLARCECVSLRLLKLILYLCSHWYPVNPLREE